MHTRISVSQDGGNLVLRVLVSLDRQSGTRTLGTRIKMAEEVAMEAWNEYFSPCLCVAPVHTCEMQTQAQMQAQANENFTFLALALVHLHLRCGSSKACLLLLALAFAFASLL